MGSGIKIVRWLACGALLASLVCLMDGCVYIPTPHGQTVAGAEVTEEDLAFLQPSITTKKDVIQRFGNPTFLWRDENIFIFRWVKLKGVMLWALAGGYTATGGKIDVSQEYAFLLKFDTGDRFVSSEIVEKPAMKSYGDFLLEWRDAQRARAWKQKTGEP